MRILQALLVSILGVSLIASIAVAQSNVDAPSYLYVEGLGRKPMIGGNQYQINFSGGTDGGKIEFVTELPVQVEDPSCEKDDYRILCQSGAYTATVVADLVTIDIFAGITLSQIEPGDRVQLENLQVPLVTTNSVTPYLVRVLDITTEGMLIEVSVINTSDSTYQGEIEMEVYKFGGGTQYIPFGVLVKAGEIETYTTQIAMVGKGNRLLSFNLEDEVYYPVGGDVYYPYDEESVLFLPKLDR